MPTDRSDKRLILTVSQLTKDIKLILENSLPEVWVSGEISNLSIPASGHIYFTLKDELAQIRAVFFKDQNRLLKFQLKDGMSVVCLGRIGVYEKTGNYQLYLKLIEPKGIGALSLAFGQLKEKLSKEGLFDEARKKPIPAFPKHLAFITSRSGAVISDMLTILKRRASQVEVSLFSVQVQGEVAAEQISQAIKLADKFYEEFDCLVLARGGGSLEDLWPFNEEKVARSVFSCRIPTVSAVGHEIDWTICDFVADMRAPTPSAAIEMLIPSREELRKSLLDLIRRLERYIEDLVPQAKQRLDELTMALSLSLRQMVELRNEKIVGILNRLKSLSPLNILARGYSVTFDKNTGKVIKNIQDINIGRETLTLLAKGSFESAVTKIREKGLDNDNKKDRF
ncbi:MAG: exodeoxyribonuclease VII large subunit [Candidatus Omnitrophota bacterium]